MVALSENCNHNSWDTIGKNMDLSIFLVSQEFQLEAIEGGVGHTAENRN